MAKKRNQTSDSAYAAQKKAAADRAAAKQESKLRDEAASYTQEQVDALPDGERERIQGARDRIDQDSARNAAEAAAQVADISPEEAAANKERLASIRERRLALAYDTRVRRENKRAAQSKSREANDALAASRPAEGPTVPGRHVAKPSLDSPLALPTWDDRRYNDAAAVVRPGNIDPDADPVPGQDVGSTTSVGLSNADIALADAIVAAAYPSGRSAPLRGNELIKALQRREAQWTWPRPRIGDPVVTGSSIQSKNDVIDDDTAFVDRTGYPIVHSESGKIIGYTGTHVPIKYDEEGNEVAVETPPPALSRNAKAQQKPKRASAPNAVSSTVPDGVNIVSGDTADEEDELDTSPFAFENTKVVADSVRRPSGEAATQAGRTVEGRKPRVTKTVIDRHSWLQQEVGADAMLYDRKTPRGVGSKRSSRMLRVFPQATIPIEQTVKDEKGNDVPAGYRIPGSNVAYHRDTGFPMSPEFHAGLSEEELAAEPRNAFQRKSELSQQGDTAYLMERNADGSIARVTPPADIIRNGRIITNASGSADARVTPKRSLVQKAAVSESSAELERARLLDNSPQFGFLGSAKVGDIIKPEGELLSQSSPTPSLDLSKNAVGLVEEPPVNEGVSGEPVPGNAGMQRFREYLASKGIDLTLGETNESFSIAQSTDTRMRDEMGNRPLAAPGRASDQQRLNRALRGGVVHPSVDTSKKTTAVADVAGVGKKLAENRSMRARVSKVLGLVKDYEDPSAIPAEMHERLVGNTKKLFPDFDPKDSANPAAAAVEYLRTQRSSLLKTNDELREEHQALRRREPQASVLKINDPVEKAEADVRAKGIKFTDESGNPDLKKLDEYAATRRGQPPKPDTAAENNALIYRTLRPILNRTTQQVVEQAPSNDPNDPDVKEALDNVGKPTLDTLSQVGEPVPVYPSEQAQSARRERIINPGTRVRTVKRPLVISPQERGLLSGIVGPQQSGADDETLATAALETAYARAGKTISGVPLPTAPNNSGLLRKRAAGEPTSAQTAKRTAEARARLAASASATPSGSVMTVGTPRVTPPVTSEPRGRQRVQDGALVLAENPGKTSEWESAMETIHANNAAVAQRFADRKAEKAGAVLAQTQADARSNLHQEWIGAGASPAVAAKWSDIGQSVEEAKHRWRQVGGGSISESQIHNAVVNKGAHVPDDVWQQHQQRATERGNQRRAAITVNNQRFNALRTQVENEMKFRRQDPLGRSSRLRTAAQSAPMWSGDFDNDSDVEDKSGVVAVDTFADHTVALNRGLRTRELSDYPETASDEIPDPFSGAAGTSNTAVVDTLRSSEAGTRTMIGREEQGARPRRTQKNMGGARMINGKLIPPPPPSSR